MNFEFCKFRYLQLNRHKAMARVSRLALPMRYTTETVGSLYF